MSAVRAHHEHRARLVSHARKEGSSGSVIIHDFTGKSNFFLFLGACRLRKRILVVLAGLCACLNFVSCGGYKSPNGPSSRLPNRVLASQGVRVTGSFGALVIVNGKNDTLPRVAPLRGGDTPGLIVVSPTRNIA